MIIVPPLGVVDFSFDRLSGAQLQAAGAAGVIRYACGGRGDVNITPAEYEDFTAHDIPVGITCEQEATFMTGGYDRGAREAQAALAVTRNAGIPDGPVFFAVDFDANSSYMPALLDTLNGCASVLGEDNAGIYGSYDVIDWLSHNSNFTAFWQTAAWSRGLTHPKAWLIQDRIWTQATPYKLDGANVDFSTVLGDWYPRQESDVLNDADKAWIQQQISNGAIETVAALMGVRQQPKGIDPTTKTTLATVADALNVFYHGIAGDPTHPPLVNVPGQIAAVQERIASITTTGGTIDPQLAADIQNLLAALNGGLSWTVTTATPKAAQ